MAAKLKIPPYLRLRTSGKNQAYWCRFRHPLRGGQWVNRTTRIPISDSDGATQLSAELSILITKKFGWDKKHTAQAQWPAAALLYYGLALSTTDRENLEVTVDHDLGVIFTGNPSTDDDETVPLATAIKAITKYRERESVANQRADQNAALAERYRLDLDTAQVKVTELERRLLAEGEDAKKVEWSTALNEFLEIGGKAGGKGSRPWSKVHARNMKLRLGWWGTKLKVTYLQDIGLSQVENAFADLQGAPGTRHNYLQALTTLLNWSISHEYLARNPLESMKNKPAKHTVEDWRALTLDEVKSLLAVASPEMRLIYELAVLSGMRVGEMRSLLVGQLDVLNSCLRPATEDTKNRKKTAQSIPQYLTRQLAALAFGKKPTEPLLPMMPAHPDKFFKRDAKAAKIEPVTAEGKAVFHSLRKAYVTLLQERCGASLPEAQKLARHSTPVLTANVYTRPSGGRTGSLVESLGALLV